MPEGDRPSLVRVGLQVFFYPLGLGAEGIIDAVLALLYPIRVQREEMDIAQVEGVEGGIVRSYAAGLSVDRHGKILIVCDLVGLLYLLLR